MKTLTLLPFLLLGCNLNSSIKIAGGSDSGSGDSDTDTDSDSDTDADTDTDTDTDVPPDEEEAPPDIVVDCHGTGDFELIQEAIDAAVSPSRIGVKMCTYHERLDMLGKQIDLYGIDGSTSTILDADQGGTAVDFERMESGWSRLAGFTIVDGLDEADGAAIEITQASVELEDIVLEDNRGLSLIRSNGGSIDMQDVRIEGNDVITEGQAVYVDGGNINMVDTYIDCDGGTQALWHHVQALIVDSELVCDTGYGVQDYHGEDRILRSKIYGGIAGYYAHDTESTVEEPDSPSEVFYVENSVIGGGTYGLDVRYMHLELDNSVFYGTAGSALMMTACDSGSWSINNVYAESACGITGDQAFSDQYSSYWHNTADACGVTLRPAVTTDPLFTSWPDDLTLGAGSPLIDAGYPAWDDTDGSRSDIGRYGGPAGGW
ncbi:hypothetical protein LBMAG42_17410 [Deltaproteobacteria bacterium]|nr:hypothetical protein LBMAG42_17410 [Deltaproteobacteria bacterium]